MCVCVCVCVCVRATHTHTHGPNAPGRGTGGVYALLRDIVSFFRFFFFTAGFNVYGVLFH